MKNLIGLFILLMIVSGDASAWGGWTDPRNWRRLGEETLRGEKDHIGGAVQDIGQQAGILLQYQITITNQTNQRIVYTIGGQPSIIPPHETGTWNIKHTSRTRPIQFDNGHNQSITYDIGEGHYNFVWNNFGVLDLFKSQ